MEKYSEWNDFFRDCNRWKPGWSVNYIRYQ